MGRKRTGMKTIREIIRLRLENQMGDRKIGRTTGVSRTVVARTLAQFRASGLSWEAVERMSDTELERTLWEKDRLLDSPRYRALEGRFAAMVQELKKKGMTLEWLWNQYREEHPEGYQYSQFCRHFQRWSAAGELWMHQEYKAGERMFSDWAGQPLVVLNANTGQDWPLDVFVGILAASGLTWVQAHESQQLPCWIRSHVAALGYFEGSPEAVSPDNVRTAVSKADRYEPEINPVFDEFAQHYHMAVFPARVGRPQDKALAENAVLLVYQRVYVPLRGRSFRSLQEVNEAIRELLEKHNNRPLQRLGISRRELFERTERAALRALPPEPFVLKDVQIATVGANYHVELREDRHYYSVPYYLRRRDEKTEVKMVYDERVVSIYHDHLRVAQHLRDRTPNGYSTFPEHMPEAHRRYGEWNAERLTRWAQEVGPEVLEVITKVLQSRTYAPQAFRACLGILSLHKRYGSLRLNQACRRALSYGSHSCTRIRNILAQGLEQESQPDLGLTAPLVAAHENVRGAAYYN
jgi:transposase